MPRTVQQRWNLLGAGQDSYAGQNAQDPKTSRRIQSWLPQDDGELHRELPQPLYAANTVSGPIVGLYEFDQNNGSGGVNRFYFCAARVNSTVGTKTCNLYQMVAGSWSAVSTVGTLADAPMCVQQENNFFLADGTSNWIFNGTLWTSCGINFPLNTPAINSTAGNSQVFFDASGVSLQFFSGSPYNGTVAINYPLTVSPVATATATTTASLLFNPGQGGNAGPIPWNWQTLNPANGAITGSVVPWSGATDHFQMTASCKLVIPVAGSYKIQMVHTDGAFFGFGNGVNSGASATLVSGPAVNIFQSLTPTNGYPIIGGTNTRAVNDTPWSDTLVVSFSQADTYPLEIAYTDWEGSGTLTFTIQQSSLTGTGSAPNPNPYYNSNSNPGSLTASVGRYYWYTNADQTTGVATESSSSPIGSSTGPITGGQIKVYQQPGVFVASTGSTTVTAFNSTDNPGPVAPALNTSMVGQVMYINGTKVGTISTVNSSSKLNLVSNSLATVATNGRAVICDARCTHWNVYASESDGSKIGQYLTSVPVTSTSYTDTSPFLDNVANTFLPIFRPVRNDPPFASKLLSVHKTRQWRRQESSPNFFAFTANEEVTSGNNGDPAQCLPGANAKTVSDMVNVVSYPDQSARLRGLISHLDSLYMFSEKQCYPLYGASVDDFAISQNVAFALGLAGRFAAKSTTNGLCFMSYDRRAFLYPTSLYASYLAQGGAAASALVEIGKPIRNILKLIPTSRLDEIVSEWYHFAQNDWWVLTFPTSTTQNTYQTWIYDFSGKGWFQLQRGMGSVAVFEVSEGALVLIGGGADGNTYVISDLTGTYSTAGTLPASTWQPALIDFGNPEVAHVFRRLELEFDSAALAQSIQITAWLDPLDVDNPGPGRSMHLRPVLGANRYAAFLTDQGGAVCKRMLLQIYAPANTLSGVIRGIELFADTAPGFITGANRVGGV